MGHESDKDVFQNENVDPFVEAWGRPLKLTSLLTETNPRPRSLSSSRLPTVGGARKIRNELVRRRLEDLWLSALMDDVVCFLFGALIYIMVSEGFRLLF